MPCIILYFWTLNNFGFYGWIISLIFIVSGCLRLARFNIDSENKSNWEINFFTGVPVPAAAGLVLLPMIISFSSFNELFTLSPFIILLVVAFVSFLMISRIPTYAIKQVKISKTIFIFLALGFVLFFSFLFQNTFETLTILGFIYLLSIPISFIHFLKLRKKICQIKL